MLLSSKSTSMTAVNDKQDFSSEILLAKLQTNYQRYSTKLVKTSRKKCPIDELGQHLENLTAILNVA